MIGQTISHYKILEKLGEGGMGIVYKALDTNLDRTVALKFMPIHINADDAEQARFLQEAKAASALNHPNVCTIYGIHDEEGRKFIEMEFVDGMTLRQKNPIQSTGDALAYGIQIGDALHEAHQKGIVHRDIKADNIMINSKNQVKVMDFGLAKLKGSLKLTKATSTVGTLAYMPPEQLQGGEIDARSDIFSYGVVLYEMLSGRLPYRSEHEAALMYSIINEDPEPIQKYRSDLSPVLVNLIQRALEKDPNDRYQSINEMVIELRRLQKQSTRVSRSSLASLPVQTASSEPSAVSAKVQNEAGPEKKNKVMKIGLSAGVVAIVGVLVWYFLLKPASRPALNPNMTFRSIQIPFQEIGYPALSRDGGWIAFAGNARGISWDIFLMNANSGDPRQVTTDSVGFMQSVDISPDGSQIVYDRADKAYTKPEIAVVSSLGGFSKLIVSLGFAPKWRPDGQRIMYEINGAWGSKSGKFEFHSINPGGSDERLEFIDSLANGQYAWSPDGKKICWTSHSEAHDEIFVYNLETGKREQLTTFKKDIGDVTWTSSDEIIFSCNMTGDYNLWSIPSAGGTPVQITRGSGPDGDPFASRDGKRLLYTQDQPIGKIWMASLSGNDAHQLTFDDVDISLPMFSPDGKKVVYTSSTLTPTGHTDALLTLDVQTGQKTQLLSEALHIHSPLWSTDGKWIIFAEHADSVEHDSSKTYILDPDNPGSPKQIGVGLPSTWVDSTSFLTTDATRTWLCTINGAAPKRFFRDSTWAIPVLDGSYVVYMNFFTAQLPGIWLAPISSSVTNAIEPKRLVKSLSPFKYDAVTHTLYYISLQNELHRILLPDGNDEIVHGTFPNLRITTGFSLSNNGKQIVYLDAKTVRKMVMIDNLH